MKQYNSTTMNPLLQESEMISGWHVIDLSWWCDVSILSDWANVEVNQTWVSSI